MRLFLNTLLHERNPARQTSKGALQIYFGWSGNWSFNSVWDGVQVCYSWNWAFEKKTGHRSFKAFIALLSCSEWMHPCWLRIVISACGGIRTGRKRPTYVSFAPCWLMASWERVDCSWHHNDCYTGLTGSSTRAGTGCTDLQPIGSSVADCQALICPCSHVHKIYRAAFTWNREGCT